ncbi:hypothetical protein D3C87_2018190 [compost metagenome]
MGGVIIEIRNGVEFMLLVVIIRLHIFQQVIVEFQVSGMIQQIFVLVPVEYLNRHKGQILS